MPFYEETFADGIEWYRTEPFGNWMPKPFRSVEGTNTERAVIDHDQFREAMAAEWVRYKGRPLQECSIKSKEKFYLMYGFVLSALKNAELIKPTEK
jgi:hypothetical protein